MKTSEDMIRKYGLNHAQALVVVDDSKELIVPAGAGSGKTKTLVTKVVKLLNEGKNLDNFLVLTFTNKAASEMKERIKKELVNEGLIEMANKIDSSNIATFDAFAYNFVKQNASSIGLDSNIELLDTVVFKMIKEDIFNDIIVNIMLNKSANKELYNFIELYTDKTSEETLIRDLMSVYYGLIENGPIKDLNISDLIYKNNIFNSNQLNEELHNVSFEFLDEYSDYFREVYTYLDYLEGKNEYKPSLKPPRFGWKKLGIDEDLKKVILKVYDPIKDLIKASPNRDDVLAYFAKEEEYIKYILEILTIYEAKLKAFKQKTNKYEFSDIANFLNQILKENADILKRQKEKFIYVFVDEYQDTSKVQTEFLDMLIDNNDLIKVLYVGDIKQSIYKFRNAKPETFIEKLNTIKSIPLTINYRSSNKVITFINKIFKEILDDKDKYDINYQDNHHMESGSLNYKTDDSADVFLEEVFKSEEDARKQFDPVEEAFVIGYKIKELLKDSKINNYSDVAILARNKSNFKIISDVFNYLNIPIQIQVDQKLKQTYMLKLIANILKLSQIIYSSQSSDFNDKRFCYYSLARSELFEKSDFSLFHALIDTNNDLNKTLIMDDEIKQKAQLLNGYIKTKTNYEIIDKVVDLFDIYNKITKTTKQTEKQYQIEYLYELSNTLADLNIVGSDFVDYIYNLAYDDNINLEIGILQDKYEDSVKVTNIHQSKGLEYNTLFVAGLNKRFNQARIRKFNFNSVAKFNINMIYKEESIELEAVSNYIRRFKQNIVLDENLKEELRLLYVVLTRAEKALYLLTTPKDSYLALNSFTDYLYENGLLRFIKKDNIKTHNKSVKTSDYYLKLTDENLYYPKEIDELSVVNFNITKQELDTSSASVSISNLINSKQRSNMLSGTKMHLDFEYQNLDNPLVKRFYETKFNNKSLSDATLYFEYEFSYKKNDEVIKGIIDLVAVYETQIHVIDYKLRDIDPSKYEKQLIVYKDYLSNVFDLDIKLYLYSIIDGNVSEII